MRPTYWRRPPDLVPTIATCIHAHLWVDRNADPFSFRIDKAVWGESKAQISEISYRSETIISHRLQSITSLTAINERLANERVRRAAALPRGIPAIGMNFSLIRCIATNIQYDGQKLSPGQSLALPAAGCVQNTGDLTSHLKTAKMKLADCDFGFGGRSAHVYNRQRQLGSSDHGNHVMAKLPNR